MTRAMFTADALSKLERIREVPLGKGHKVYVRLLPGSAINILANLSALPAAERSTRLLSLMLCDNNGNSLYTYDAAGWKALNEWPAGYQASALAEGATLNGLGDDDGPE